ncbi:unnamed protein product [Leptidea sinapis]|uniref:Uncharacterized protein n=1 Tax=Leptidea sinapis TaxID=189913 RepID=A0A5E4R236_9NEOP|nr:unnamed protein product [Leptidea sinapis]
MRVTRGYLCRRIGCIPCRPSTIASLWNPNTTSCSRASCSIRHASGPRCTILEKHLIQESSIPTLGAEYEHKLKETLSALRNPRSLNNEIERLTQENMQLSAQRMQLKQQCEDMNGRLARARAAQSELVTSLQQDEQDIDIEVRKYEDTLRGVADQFRQHRAYINKDEVKSNIEMMKNSMSELELEEHKVEELGQK